MSIMLLLTPFIFGYYAAQRLFREDAFFNSCLSVPVGISVSLFLLLCLLRFLPFTQAAWLTALFLIIGTFLLAYSGSKGAGAPFNAAVPIKWGIALSLSIIFFYSLLALLANRDDDFVMHCPRIALIQNNFSPRINPFFPDVELHGHIGRDVFFAFLSTISQCNLLSMLLIAVPFIQISTFLLIFHLVRKMKGNDTAALLTSLFVFFGVNAGFAHMGLFPGLVQGIHNNNPVVYSVFFFIIYLLVSAIKEKSAVYLLISAVTLGLFDIIYETHYAILSGTCAMLTVYLMVIREDIRRTVLCFMSLMLVSLLISLLFGGLTSTCLLKKINSSYGMQKAVSQSETLANQNISLSFPRRPLLHITDSSSNEEVFILGYSFLGSQGISLMLLPVLTALCLKKKDILLSTVGIAGMLFLFIPSVCDFGTFNAESLRFVAASGICGAFVFASTLGELIIPLLVAEKRTVRYLSFLILAAFLAFSFSHFIKGYGALAALAVRNPQSFPLMPESVFIQRGFSHADLHAARWLKKSGRTGDRFITSFTDEREPLKIQDYLVNVITVSGIPSCQTGLRKNRLDYNLQEGMSYLTTCNREARAFWDTLDVEALRPLKVTWIYVKKGTISNELSARLKENRHLRLEYHQKDPYSMEEIEIFSVHYDSHGHYDSGSRIMKPSVHYSTSSIASSSIQKLPFAEMKNSDTSSCCSVHRR